MLVSPLLLPAMSSTKRKAAAILFVKDFMSCLFMLPANAKARCLRGLDGCGEQVLLPNAGVCNESTLHSCCGGRATVNVKTMSGFNRVKGNKKMSTMDDMKCGLDAMKCSVNNCVYGLAKFMSSRRANTGCGGGF